MGPRRGATRYDGLPQAQRLDVRTAEGWDNMARAIAPNGEVYRVQNNSLKQRAGQEACARTPGPRGSV
eukprot:scaffold6211_cov118-Isochrysis_galbana.AAC.2